MYSYKSDNMWLEIRGNHGDFFAVSIYRKAGSMWIPLENSTNYTKDDIEKWKLQENAHIVESTLTEN
jgi:hypothetical protein